MSTSLLYHGFGIRGYEHVRTYYEEGGIIFKIRQQRNELRCPCCGSRDVTCRGQVERPFKSLPIGLKPVSILLAIQRVWCVACDVVRQIRIGFADQRRSYTRSFERYGLELLRHMTIQDVAQHLGVSWGAAPYCCGSEKMTRTAPSGEAPSDRHAEHLRDHKIRHMECGANH